MQERFCPKHFEKTPSSKLHPSGKFWFSFCCGYIEWVEGVTDEEKKNVEKYKEDLKEAIGYIETLPEVKERGLLFKRDSRGYYIVWPGNIYYKLRIECAESGSKYRCPAGHKKPLFRLVGNGQRNTLWIVEGEINAMSLKLVCDDDIVSPGGVSEFTREDYLTQYMGYEKINIVADRDAAGIKAIIQLKAKLVQHTPNVQVFALKEDLNELLTRYGKERIREVLGMSRKLQSVPENKDALSPLRTDS